MALGYMYNILETITNFIRKNCWKLLQSYQKCQLAQCPGMFSIISYLKNPSFWLISDK